LCHRSLCRWLQILRPLHGIIFLAIFVLPWLIAIYARTGDAFILQSVGHDTLGKITTAQEKSRWATGILSHSLFRDILSCIHSRWFGGTGDMGKTASGGHTISLGMARALVGHFELSVTKLPHYVMRSIPPSQFLSLERSKQRRCRDSAGS